MVMELANGDLRGTYAKPTGGEDDTYTFQDGLKVIVGAAKGLAYMHSMPSPVLHRDIKSANIMVMKDGTGKVGDCGESRRVVSLFILRVWFELCCAVHLQLMQSHALARTAMPP